LTFEESNPYGFRRPSIKIDPDKDNDVFLVRRDFAESIVKEILEYISAGQPFSIVIDGAPGIGKTHLLRFIEKKVSSKCKTLYVKVPDSFPKKGYLDLHESIIFKIGEDKLKNLFLRTRDLTSFINGTQSRSKAKTEFTCTLLGILMDKINERNWSVFYSFITGNKISRTEARELGLPRERITEQDAVDFLGDVAEALSKLEGKPLLLLVDEMDHFDALLTKREEILALQHAIRGLFEKNFSKIFAFTGRAQERIFMSDPTVARRITFSKTIEEYTPEELRLFLKEQIKYFRLENFDPTQSIKKIEGIPEHITIDSYPFTEEALEMIVQKTIEAKEKGSLQNLRPQEPMELAMRTVFHGYRCKKPYLDTSAVEVSLQ